MKGLKFAILLGMTLPLFGLRNEPWIPSPYEFVASAQYSYSYFPSVDNGVPRNFSSYENQLELSLSGSATTEFFAEIELLFDNSTQFPQFALEAVIPSVKYQLLDDLKGDPVALLIGTHFTYVPSNQLPDLTTPYAGSYNFDFMFSVGKEFDRKRQVAGRVFAMFDVGVATVGSPWIIGDVMAEAYLYEQNVLIMGVDGYFGLGNQKTIYVNNFNGYGEIQHRSMNIKLAYQYNFKVWGSLRAEYKRRVYAVSYPEFLNYGSIAYQISFSF